MNTDKCDTVGAPCGPVPDSAVHRVRPGRVPGAFPALEAQPIDDAHVDGHVRLWRRRGWSGDLHGRRQSAGVHGAP